MRQQILFLIAYSDFYFLFFNCLSILPCLNKNHPEVFFFTMMCPCFLLSVCPTLSLPTSLPATLSLAGSLRLEWWFRPHCEFSNPIQHQPKSEGGEVALGEQGREWETRGIMGVPMAISMMSGAPGALALYLPSGLPVALILCFSFTSLSLGPNTRELFTVPFWNPLFPSVHLSCAQTYQIVGDFIRKMIRSLSKCGMPEQLATSETFNSASLSVAQRAAVTSNKGLHIKSKSRWCVCEAMPFFLLNVSPWIFSEGYLPYVVPLTHTNCDVTSSII